MNSLVVSSIVFFASLLGLWWGWPCGGRFPKITSDTFLSIHFILKTKSGDESGIASAPFAYLARRLRFGALVKLPVFRSDAIC
jgi:hypothetical protein